MQYRRERSTWVWLTGSWSGSCATPLLWKAGASSRQRATSSAREKRALSAACKGSRLDEAIFLFIHTDIEALNNESWIHHFQLQWRLSCMVLFCFFVFFSLTETDLHYHHLNKIVKCNMRWDSRMRICEIRSGDCSDISDCGGEVHSSWLWNEIILEYFLKLVLTWSACVLSAYLSSFLLCLHCVNQAFTHQSKWRDWEWIKQRNS